MIGPCASSPEPLAGVASVLSLLNFWLLHCPFSVWTSTSYPMLLIPEDLPPLLPVLMYASFQRSLLLPLTPVVLHNPRITRDLLHPTVDYLQALEKLVGFLLPTPTMSNISTIFLHPQSVFWKNKLSRRPLS